MWGLVDDDLAFLSPWGFDVSEIRVPIRVIYGESDVLVPKRHGEWLAENVPGGRLSSSAISVTSGTPISSPSASGGSFSRCDLVHGASRTRTRDLLRAIQIRAFTPHHCAA